MKLLLDTHVFLWFILNDARLTENTRQSIQNRSNDVYVSVVSIWEACLKYHLGKLSMPADPSYFLPQQRIAHLMSPLALTEGCLRHLQTLPPMHKDPFDRMLLCQALEHGCKLVTDDAAILAYSAPTLAI